MQKWNGPYKVIPAHERDVPPPPTQEKMGKWKLPYQGDDWPEESDWYWTYDNRRVVERWYDSVKDSWGRGDECMGLVAWQPTTPKYKDKLGKPVCVIPPRQPAAPQKR